MSLDMIVDKEIKINSKPKMMKIDIDDINTNYLNFYNIENIDELKNDIETNGLYRPLEVYPCDNQYKLIGGQRRYTALKELIEEDKIDSEIQCLVYKAPADKTDELLQIITSNVSRMLDEEEKVTITKKLLELLEEKPEIKATGVATRDFLAAYLGCSPRTAQKYKNKAEGKEEEEETSEENVPAPKVKEELDEIEKFDKFIQSFLKKLKKAYDDEDFYNIIEFTTTKDDMVEIINLLGAIVKF